MFPRAWCVVDRDRTPAASGCPTWRRSGAALPREALVSLRTRSKLAQQRAEQRTLRAPHPGFVGDVCVRESQLNEPGMRLLDLQGQHGIGHARLLWATGRIAALTP